MTIDSSGNSGVDTRRRCEMLDRNAMSAADHQTALRRAVLTLIVAGYFGLCCLVPRWMDLMGVGRLKIWFVDTHAVLAASDAHALGLSPDVPNPLDIVHQPHTYSDWWFVLHAWHLDRGDYLWLGAVLGFLFLVVAVGQLQVRSWGEVLWSAAIVCSPPVVFAFNRGNIDLLVFVTLSALVPCLLARHAFLRWVGIAAVFAATVMKFYPVIAGLLLMAPTRPRHEIRAQVMVLTAALIAFALTQVDSAHRYFSGPHPSGFFTFGIGLGGDILGAPPWTMLFTATGLIGLAIACARRPSVAEPPGSEHEASYLRFVLGAVILAACYFVTINYSYRAICAVWLAPFLWAAWSDRNQERHWRWVVRATAVLLVFLLWFDALVCVGINAFRRLSVPAVEFWTNRIVLLEQPMAAALMVFLSAYVVMFIRHALQTEVPAGTNTPWVPKSGQIVATARTAPFNHAGLAAIAGIGYAACIWGPKILQLLGIDNLGIWFLDMEGALAATDANAQGLPALGGNPLDVFHRPHLYSRWWHALGWLGLTRADYIAVGAFAGFLFLVVAVLQLRVRSRQELVWSAAFLLAPPMLFAFDRGNADLLMFVVLAAAVPLMLSPRTAWRWLALAVIMLAAGLKWYPALAGIVLVAPTRGRREIIAQVILFLAVAAFLAVSQYRDVEFNLHLYNSEHRLPGFYLFGVGLTAALLHLSTAWTVSLVLILSLVAVAVWRWSPKIEIPGPVQPQYLAFILGATLLAGCYFLTINYTYRAVFALFTAPFLWTASSAPQFAGRVRQLSRLTAGLLLTWLWSDGIACLFFNTFLQTSQPQLDAWSQQFVLAQQPLVFLLVAAFLGFIAVFVRDSLHSLLAGAKSGAAASERASSTGVVT